MIITLSGRSGVGKTTVMNELLHFSCKRVITYTTRKIRVGEVNGIDYVFLSREEFMRFVELGQIWEFAEYFDNLYGSGVINEISDRIYIVVLEEEGAIRYKDFYKSSAKTVLLMASDSVLHERRMTRKDFKTDTSNRIIENEFNFNLFDIIIISVDGKTPKQIAVEIMQEVQNENGTA